MTKMTKEFFTVLKTTNGYKYAYYINGNTIQFKKSAAFYTSIYKIYPF